MQEYFSSVDDVQQARHLARQSGWFILSGRRGDGSLKNGEYKLASLEKPFPSYFPKARKTAISDEDWENIKKRYDNRCACCGSKEGEPNIYSPTSTTVLQKGHMNPFKSLTIDNLIPQCSICNQPDKDKWIYDIKGRVIALANPLAIKKSPIEVRRKVFEILIEEFGDK